MTDSCFQLKGSVVTVVVLELHHYTAEAFTAELEQKIQQAPQLLAQSPIVIDLEKFSGSLDEAGLVSLLAGIRELGLQPLGFRSCLAFNEAIRTAGLALLPAVSSRGSAGRRETAPAPAEDEPATEQAAPDPGGVSRRNSKLITQPVRSGQQIYAQDADLIVMSQVSEGAELLADGNIHVYGGLRGRALAGVHGDNSARIFCRRMEAELLSVAGNFVLSDDIREELQGKPTQVYLEDGKLCLEPLA